MQDTEMESRFKKFVSKTTKSMSFNEYDIILHQYGFGYNSYEQKKHLRLELLDGDFAIVYEDSPYIGEYHSNSELMGLIKYNLFKISNSESIEVYSEYRFKESSKNAFNKEQIELKHMLFVQKRGNKTAQYIYDSSGNLLCRQIDNDIYIADNARNLLPKWGKKELGLNSSTSVSVYYINPSDENPSDENISNEHSSLALKKVFKIATTPLVVAGFFVALAGVVPVYILSNADEGTCNDYWNMWEKPYEWWERLEWERLESY